MRISGAGLELIKSFEGFRARASQVPSGAWLIGYGHTASAREGVRITKADAELVLYHHDLPPIEKLIHDRVLTPLSQNEFDAICSFVFNIGKDAFSSSDVLAHLNRGARIEAAESMSDWRRGRFDGQLRVIDALVRRRAAEIALFLDHPSGPVPLPSAMVRAELDITAMRPSVRDRPIVIEPRFDTDRGVTPKPARTESLAEAAGRSISDRQTRILTEPKGIVPAEPVTKPAESGDGPTVEEITKAISELADPEGTNTTPDLSRVFEGTRLPDGAERRKAPRPEPANDILPEPAREEPIEERAPPVDLTPPEAPVIDDLEQIDLDPDLAARAVVEDDAVNRRPPAKGWLSGLWRWLPYALLTGLGGIGVLTGVQDTLENGRTEVASETQLYAGPVLALLSGLLLIMGLYYLFRALTRDD
jgi:lysozyme